MTSDFAIFSYPKCGRTWVRFLLAWYLKELYQLDLDVDFHSIFRLLPNNSKDPQRGVPAFAYGARDDIPKIVFSHLPVESNLPVPIIFLSRCPLDTLISEYFQKKNRQKIFAGSVSEYLRSPHGLLELCNYYNHSCASMATMGATQPENRLLLLSYEQLHADTTEALRQVLALVDVPLDEAMVQKAIEKSSIDKMRQSEIERGFPSQQARGETSDPNALRAREGKTGGYSQHLTDADVSFARQYLRSHLNDSVNEVLPSLLANVR